MGTSSWPRTVVDHDASAAHDPPRAISVAGEFPEAPANLTSSFPLCPKRVASSSAQAGTHIVKCLGIEWNNPAAPVCFYGFDCCDDRVEGRLRCGSLQANRLAELEKAFPDMALLLASHGKGRCRVSVWPRRGDVVGGCDGPFPLPLDDRQVLRMQITIAGQPGKTDLPVDIPALSTP